jgi:hypothetical protein
VADIIALIPDFADKASRLLWSEWLQQPVMMRFRYYLVITIQHPEVTTESR